MIVKVIAAIIAVFLASQTEATAGDNVKEFGLLCQLVAACETGMPTTAAVDKADISDVLDTLVAINLSSADDEFFNRNFGEDSDHKGEPNYTKYKEQWKKLKANTLKRKIGSSDELLQRLPDNSLRRHVQLEALAAIEATQAAQAQLPEAKTAAQINDELKAVLYGADQQEAATDSGKTFGTNGEAACGNDGSADNAAGRSLANDLVCLCGGNGGNTPAEGCLHTGATITNKFTGEAAGATSYTEIKGKCLHKDGVPTVSVERLTALASHFKTLIGVHAAGTSAKNYHYGKGGAATCSAANQEGCINYKHQLETDGRGIQWLKTLQEAIDDMRKQQTRSAAIQQLESRAKEEERKVLLAYKQAQAIASLASATAAAQGAQSRKPTKEEQNKCAKFDKNETHCPPDSCEYDKKQNKCKPKSGTESTPTGEGTGTGAEGTGPNCGQYTDPEKCAKAQGKQKDGKKSVCGWTDFIDRQEKVEPKFFDSIFLVNNTIYPMAAFFMSLVSFEGFSLNFMRLIKIYKNSCFDIIP
ncbi:variant surface glycoprotein VSG [Trypanosoma brucei equiperdum]|uniref:Variant surface glycoprotein VSG n=1 Tax=Trypanosoma brucei equiperdum TaxID=630700 RepID=A0A3L6KQ37_9TRYP|nr:variant surface glycoprotein VSG [Trypanosoma brucei equiperdum]RHW66826.1 variant surface glycoprotein VSG [Trypanosoma brucei equiperdum]RHW66833.1 variant surface glycoprotein VSG [Trypanosoma brucei equiperdum]RHW66895.1 variant surface glycoprotein VSG [Trypanosoma brucei equiperdum]